MARTRALALSLIAALALAAAACGGGDESSAAETTQATTAAPATTAAATTEATTVEATTSAATGTVPASEWVGSVCTALTTWQQELTGNVPDFSNVADPAATKNALADYLRQVVASTNSMIDGVASAGVPDVDEGETIAAEFQTALGSVRDSFEQASADVESLSADDPTKLTEGLRNVATSLQAAGQQAGQAFDDLGQKYPTAGLDEAAASAPACAAITG